MRCSRLNSYHGRRVRGSGTTKPAGHPGGLIVDRSGAAERGHTAHTALAAHQGSERLEQGEQAFENLCKVPVFLRSLQWFRQRSVVRFGADSRHHVHRSGTGTGTGHGYTENAGTSDAVGSA
jgi:hypothetical protein